MRKIKVNINRPQANPEQVAGLQQFDQMLSMYKKAKYLFYAKVAAIVTGVVAVAAVAGYLLLVKPDGHSEGVNKLSPNDPYASTMVESQYYELDATKDTVVEGAQGTVIAIPAGAFLDEDGNVFSGKVKLEIAEAYTAADLIAGNISTDKNYGIQKALFVKATDGSKELNYNPDKPVIAEVPVESTTQPQVILDGTRNDKGEMSWTSRGPVKKYLITLPLAQLDFLPNGFEEEVQKHMPYRGREVANKALVDSLYYSIDAYMHKSSDTTSEQMPYSTPVSYLPVQNYGGDNMVSVDLSYMSLNGIRPASIQAIKGDKFQNSFIATVEFQQRLKELFTICDQSLLEIYLNNIDKDLWVSDSLVAEKLGLTSPSGKTFLVWSKQRLTNVKDAPASAMLLGGYYKKRFFQIEEQLKRERLKYKKLIAKEDKEAREIRESYKKLLRQRFVYRLEKFGIKIEKNGWVSLAVVLSQLPQFELKATVENGQTYDHVHVYVVNPIVQSLFAMTAKDQIHFDGAYPEDPILLLYKGQKAILVTVGYKGDKIYADTQQFQQKKIVNLHVALHEVTALEFKGMINSYRSYLKINSIEVDLDYQKKFYKEKLRQERLAKERIMMHDLVMIACPCTLVYH